MSDTAQKRKVLVTGGAGFIGLALCKQLHAHGDDVIVLDNFSGQVHGDNPAVSSELKSIAEVIVGDVRSVEDWKKALRSVDVVVHLAAETGTGQSMYAIHHYADVNINGTAILLDLLANDDSLQVKNLVVASSRSIYGEGRYKCNKHGYVYPSSRDSSDLNDHMFDARCPLCDDVPQLVATTEDSLLSPASIYASTKKTQEELCLIAGAALDIGVVALRFQNVYGPGQSLQNPYTGILSIFSTRILNGNEINIFEDGKESRDFVYIDDVVNGIVAATKSDVAMGESINIGSGKPVSVLEVVSELGRNFGVDVKYSISGSYRIGDIRHNYSDNDKAKKLMGWEPSVEFKDGISKFVAWVLEQEVMEDSYDKSISELKERGLYK